MEFLLLPEVRTGDADASPEQYVELPLVWGADCERKKMNAKKKFTPITKADKDKIMEHFKKTKCPLQNQKALLEQIDDLWNQIRSLEKKNELLVKYQNFERMRGKVLEVLWKVVDLTQDFNLHSSVGYDGPRNPFEAEAMKLAIDARMIINIIQ